MEQSQRVILLGLSGSGKTSIFNFLTDSNEQLSSGPNFTQITFSKNTKEGNKYIVYDTPSLGSLDYKELHISRILDVMEKGQLSRIILVCKYDQVDLLMQNINQLLLPFKRYIYLITVVITHWDHAGFNANIQQKIQKKCKDIYLESILFLSKYHQGNEFKDSFEKIIQNSKLPTLIQLTDQEIKSLKTINNITWQPSVVLIGALGHGKTTLYNKITKSTEYVAEGGESATQIVNLKKSAYGKGFKVLDTPGLESLSNVIIHVAAILAALSEGPLHRIILVVKYERTDIMIRYIRSFLKTFARYKKIVTVAVTHIDTQTKKDLLEKDKNDLKEKCKQFELDSWLFFKKQDSGEQICNMITGVIEQSESQQVNLTDNEVLQSFQFLTDESEIYTDVVQQHFDKLKNDFYKKASSIKKFIQNLSSDDQQLVDKMYFVQQEITYIAEDDINKLLLKLQEKNNHFKNAQNQFHFRCTAKYDLKVTLQEIIDFASRKIFESNQEVMKNFKQCPECGEIWMKTEGCEGTTICGNIPFKLDNKGVAPQEFVSKWEGDKFLLEINPNYRPPKQQLYSKRNSRQKQPEKVLLPGFLNWIWGREYAYKQYGCGASFSWSQAKPILTCKLDDLVDPALQQYYKKEDERLTQEQRQAKSDFSAMLQKSVQVQRDNIKRG